MCDKLNTIAIELYKYFYHIRKNKVKKMREIYE